MGAEEGRVSPVSRDEFLRLTADVSLHLQSRPFSVDALLELVIGPARLPDTAPVREAIGYLREGYGVRQRKNGTLAILHPLRTAAILSRSMAQPTFLDFFGALLHDKEEDLTPDEVGTEEWHRLQRQFNLMLEKIDRDQQWFLGERISLLSRLPGETYHGYLVKILGRAQVMKDLLHCKLADRLDNTLDIAVQRQGRSSEGFFEAAFGVLFLPAFQIPRGRAGLPEEAPCVLLLSQLFKNAVFLSLLRSSGLHDQDETTERLFAALAQTSRTQAEWIAMELLAADFVDPDERYQVLRETMAYCHGGGLAAVRAGDEGRTLDGTFLEHYAVADNHERKRQLAAIYANRRIFVRLMVVFVAIFTCFLSDRGYFIQGIDASGIRPVP